MTTPPLKQHEIEVDPGSLRFCDETHAAIAASRRNSGSLEVSTIVSQGIKATLPATNAVRPSIACFSAIYFHV